MPSINPLFTDENAACIVWDENVFFMVLTKEYFATFTDKPIIDPDDARAGAHRAQPRHPRGRRHGARGRPRQRRQRAAPGAGLRLHVLRDLDDPDGNSLGFLYMDPVAAEKGPEAYLAEQAQV